MLSTVSDPFSSVSARKSSSSKCGVAIMLKEHYFKLHKESNGYQAWNVLRAYECNVVVVHPDVKGHVQTECEYLQNAIKRATVGILKIPVYSLLWY